MPSFNKVYVTTAALMASTMMANAADLLPPPVFDDYPPEVSVSNHDTGNWYIRGDIGYVSADVEGVTYQQYQASGAALNTGKFSQHDLDSTWSFQGGIGYQATDYLRVDATLKYMMGADFDGASVGGSSNNCAGATFGTIVAGSDCSYNDDTELESATLLMANAYVDLGTFNHFTPYVGAGIGGAHVKWGDLHNDQTCGATSTGNDANCSTYDYTHGGESEWRFAWAIHAGASYDVSCRTKIDAGYTYTRVEGGRMFGSGRHATGGFHGGGYGWDDGLEFHEGRVGLRYALDDSGCHQPAPQHPPVVFK